MDAHVARTFFQEMSKLSAKDDSKRLMKKLMDKSPVTVVVHHEPGGDALRTALVGPHFANIPDDNKIHLLGSSDQDVLAHEIGHALLDESMTGRMLQAPVFRIMKHVSPGAAFIGGVMARTPAEVGAAAALGAAANVPVLADEAAASVKGYKVLKQVGATKDELKKYRKDLGKAWLTYMISPVGAAVNAAVGAGLSGKAFR